MRNYERELTLRVKFLRESLQRANAHGFVFGNSGGKDSALIGILCKKACENTVGIALPCASKQNYERDLTDALSLSEAFAIETRTIDLTETREALLRALSGHAHLTDTARTNIAPRLRMTTLYAIAAAESRLVVGSGNLCELHMGYFTKWGDGASDVNPIADLAVSEIYAFLRFLGAPDSIISKEPSAGLYEGQTDEAEMGVTYAAIERYLETGEGAKEDIAIIERYHRTSEHKRGMPLRYAAPERRYI